MFSDCRASRTEAVAVWLILVVMTLSANTMEVGSPPSVRFGGCVDDVNVQEPGLEEPSVEEPLCFQRDLAGSSDEWRQGLHW
jgi:hypothetical protein